LSNPGIEIEALASLDEDARTPGATAVYQTGQDKAPQAGQGELKVNWLKMLTWAAAGSMNSTWRFMNELLSQTP
jgi:hypothetical protein